jgi:hypothetical protein
MLLVIALPMSLALGEERAPSALERELARLEQALDKEEGLLPQTRDALRGLVRALRAERAEATRAPARPAVAAAVPRKGEVARAVDEYLAARAPARESKTWEKTLERLSLHGDLRLRHEFDFERDDEPDRYRGRARLRLGADYRVTDGLVVGGRLRTGNPDDPNSPYVTFGDVFDSFDFELDRAYLTWRPPGKRSWVTLGKFNHPFYRNPVYSELVWDADVQPEGVALGTTIPGRGRLRKVDLMAGGYTVLEQADADDAFVLAAQAAAELALARGRRLNLAVGWYDHRDTTPGGSLAILGDNAGNATIDTNRDRRPDAFASRFAIINPILAVTLEQGRFPLTIAGEYIANTRAVGPKGDGWAVGASYGRTARARDWRVYYQWQVVEQDAVFSPFSQDDFLFQTNHRSHVFGANHQLRDQVGLHLWALVSARDRTTPGRTTDSADDQWRVRLDTDVKF